MARTRLVTIPAPLRPVLASEGPRTRAATTQRLSRHLARLASLGISGLADLGTLRIGGSSPSTVIPQPGLLRPGGPVALPGVRSLEQVTVWSEAGLFAPSPKPLDARLLRAEPFPQAQPAGRRPVFAAGATISLDTAYWAARRIEIADDTTVVLLPRVGSLTVLCEELVVGQNVTFTWDPPELAANALRKIVPDPATPRVRRPPTPDTPKTSGARGAPGLPGVQPGGGGRGEITGQDGARAPEVELWALTVQGAPRFFLRGQDGFQGPEGCDGGAGGDGARGRSEKANALGFCERAASRGGAGGDGGRAGDGARGGRGGGGGQLRVFAPEAALQAWLQRGLDLSADGGAGGPGGIPGTPGPGGDGGAPGDTIVCIPPPGYVGGPQRPGRAGAQGRPGRQGEPGESGPRQQPPFRYTPIDADQLRRRQTDPAITALRDRQGGPPLERAFEGQAVLLEGQRLSQGDLVLVDGREAPTIFRDTEHLTFRVPAAPGGRRAVQVRRAGDGALSNVATLTIAPRVTSPAAGTRLSPGAVVELRGSGFAPDCQVRINDEPQLQLEFVDANTLRFRLVRPGSVTPNRAGEPVDLEVVLPENAGASEPLRVVLDTFRIAVFGDSILWGQGLEDGQKTYRLVEAAIRSERGNIGVYSENFAHSGAIVGVGHPGPALPPIDGELPTDAPTILEQVERIEDSPETVDLVLVNGGLNDVNFRTILPSLDAEDLRERTRQRCGDDMRVLLGRITERFLNATVVVAGYYPVLTDDSDATPDELDRLLEAAGVDVAAFKVGVSVLGLGGLDYLLFRQMVRNCQIFAEVAEAATQAAVDEINARLALPGRPDRVRLVVPEIGSRNAALGPEPLIFGINSDGSPEDGLAGHRAQAIELAPQERISRFTAARASAGHPNRRGARAYASAILSALRPQTFPQGFLWGVATAAYQVEGGITNNDWHIFTSTPSIRQRVADLGQAVNLDVDLQPAGDAVRHRDLDVLRADLDRALALGLNAYRFSIEWSRVEPALGQIDNSSLDYYDQVLAALAERGLEPVVTLNHLTLPDWVLTPPRQTDALQAIGLGRARADAEFENGSLRGWESEATIDAFLAFVTRVADRYKDRVRTWVTLNEPVGSSIGIGYIGGLWSPGFTLEGTRAKRAYFNLLRAHVRAFDRIKQIYGPRSSQVGIAHAMMSCKLSQDGKGLFDEQRRARDQFEHFMSWHILDALVNGQVERSLMVDPDQPVLVPPAEAFGLPAGEPWRSRLDFLGINYYRSVYVRAYEPHEVIATLPLDVAFIGGKIDPDLARQPGGATRPAHLLNDLGWELHPRGLYQIIREVGERFDGLPVLITENGLAEDQDRNRAASAVAHLEQISRAIQEGSRVLGYLHWTLVDNFEWQENYRPQARFGLYTVDRGSPGQDRHITEGALALQLAARQNGLGLLYERYGRVNPSGLLVSPPSASPGALYSGRFAGGAGIQLLFSRVAGGGGGLVGLCFDAETGMWQILEGVSLEGATLRFTRRVGPAATEDWTATRSGASLRGSVGGRAWSASRDPLYGTWRRAPDSAAPSAPPYLHLHALEGERDALRARHLTGGLEASWRTSQVQRTATGIELEFGGIGSFTGSARDGALTGTFRPFPSPVRQPASWTRLPDGTGL